VLQGASVGDEARLVYSSSTTYGNGFLLQVPAKTSGAKQCCKFPIVVEIISGSQIGGGRH